MPIMSGKRAFLDLLRQEGVKVMFGNPGTTELPIMHALSSAPEMGYVLGLQEAVVICMADGYARASNKLVSCNVHVAPGLGNAIGSIYTSQMSGTPMIVTAGQQEQGHGLTEPLLYAPLVPMAQPVVKWATEVNRIEDLPFRLGKLLGSKKLAAMAHAAKELGKPTAARARRSRPPSGVRMIRGTSRLAMSTAAARPRASRSSRTAHWALNIAACS